MKRKVNKEKLAIIINKRFPRIANYLKKQNKSKDIETNHLILCITYNLYKIYLNTITDNITTNDILLYLENNYIKDYIKLVDNITIKDLKEIITSTYITITNKKLIENINEQSIINTYNAIKKSLNYIEII